LHVVGFRAWPRTRHTNPHPPHAQVTDFLGAAAFSRAVQATDIQTGSLVCLKIIKNNKDYLDQSLDEIKLLKYVNDADPADEHGIVRLYDFFYYKVRCAGRSQGPCNPRMCSRMGCVLQCADVLDPDGS
jgi:hypothetical protein